MKLKAKLLCSVLMAGCALSGLFALAACGDLSNQEAHTHSYGDSWIIVAPTESAAGSAKKVCSGCEEGTEGHELVLTLPVLTDEGYSKTADTATCEEGGEVVYSVTVDGNALSFPVATPAKGHAYHEHEAVPATCTAAGNEKYFTCDNCTAVFDENKTVCEEDDWVIAAAGHAYHEHAAVPATCTTAGNEKYFTCDNCTAVFDENKTVCEEDDWVIAEEGHAYGEWEVTAPTDSAAGSATKSCTKCDAETAGHTVTVELPALTADNLEAYSVDHTKLATRLEDGTDTYTYEQDGETVSFEKDVAFVVPALEIGDNTVVISVAFSSIDSYTFNQTEAKKYDFTLVEAEMKKLNSLTVTLDGTLDEDGAPTGGTQVYDSVDGTYAFTVDVAKGNHTLYFSAGAKGSFSLRIEEHIPDPDEGKLSPSTPVAVKIGARATKSIEIASTVEPGWYRLYPEGAGITEAALGRKKVRAYINNVRIPGTKDLEAVRSKTGKVQDDFTIVAYLKPGDIVSYEEMSGLGVNLETIHMEAHEHGTSGTWLVTKQPTATAKGTAQLSCAASGLVEGFELPVLTDEGYTTESVEGGTKYTYTYGGVTISFTVKDA